MINRKELNKKLPRGYRKIISSELGISQAFISSWFSYNRNSEKVELAVLKKLAELKKEKDLLLEKI